MKRIAILLAVMLAAGAAQAGDWTTSYGTMTLPDMPGNLRIFTHYSVDNGRLLGMMNMQGDHAVITANWVETGSAKACAEALDGSLHWGAVTLTFNADYTSFDGSWDYCGTGGGGAWTGALGAKRVLLGDH